MPEQDEGAFKICSVALFFSALKDSSFLIVSWCFKVLSLGGFLLEEYPLVGNIFKIL